MRWTRWTSWFFGITAIAALAAVSCTTSSTTQKPAEMSAADKVALGARLVHVAACEDCHTPGTFYGAPDTTRRFSGSELGWQGPWGVSFPRNLTPDMETGIGSWSEDDIVTAIRTGQRPEKSLLLPPMPWPQYAHMTDEEAHAIAAYLKSIPPVKHKSPDQIPPGAPFNGPHLTFPGPPQWDAMNLPPPPNAPA